MAFVTLTPLPLSTARATRATTCARPTMSAGAPVGRRAALHLLAAGVGATFAASARAEGVLDELSELKEEVGELKYEDEVTDEGPAEGENIITKSVATEETPEYVKEQAELKAEKGKEYDEMVKVRQRELDAIKAKFGKGL